MASCATYDAVIVGGGFFGCEVALTLRRLGFGRLLVVEQENALLQRASFVNQARVHNGYHYPRSFVTAARSRFNYLRFADEFADAVVGGFTKLYAIPRGSRVSASQFSAFCSAIGAPCQEASAQVRHLFNSELVEQAFLTQELAFDAQKLAARTVRQLDAAKIEVRLGSKGVVTSSAASAVKVDVRGSEVTTPWLFNCTYSALEGVGVSLKSRIKKELTEMLLIEPPMAMRDLGVTLMDGPYFSTMPFPSAGLHSLSHVRYTPHASSEEIGWTPAAPTRSNGEAMIRDAARYIPCLASARVVRSLFEVKAVLSRTESDDARPIMIERSDEHPRVVSVLGSKIDNIYDARDYLRAQQWN
ncbi:FAD-dependent oxidoreductase [Sphingomonas sp. LHG3443-2]|uniref:FAD-dependent oxidoreductase n=1 Tax=Sphingomonas sp. LHG3443-2 TaxID=2804639 RepID=UPI003CEF0918